MADSLVYLSDSDIIFIWTLAGSLISSTSMFWSLAYSLFFVSFSWERILCLSRLSSIILSINLPSFRPETTDLDRCLISVCRCFAFLTKTLRLACPKLSTDSLSAATCNCWLPYCFVIYRRLSPSISSGGCIEDTLDRLVGAARLNATEEPSFEGLDDCSSSSSLMLSRSLAIDMDPPMRFRCAL